MSEQVLTLSLDKQTTRPQRGELELHIRRSRYDDRDYEAAVAIENAYYPELAQSADGWRHWDSVREPQYLWRRYLGEIDGTIVATAEIGHASWAHRPGKYHVYVAVVPSYQRRGIGSAFFDFLLDEAHLLEATKLTTRAREDHEQSFRFLEKRGFKSVLRACTSCLQVAEFDPAPFQQKVERVLQSGITIKTMAQLRQEDPDWKRKMYDLDWDCLKDVPHSDPLTRHSFEQFEKGILNHPRLLDEAWFIALDGERYVGLSVLWPNHVNRELLETGLTGVVSSYRRRGIATALKVRAIEYAAANGALEVTTDNEENNPMLQINLQLGFKERPAFHELHRNLAPRV